MNAAHRYGDVIRAVGTPNVSQPWGVYQTDWKAVLWTQGNIYYTQDKVWFQPAYYVDQMIARHWAPDVVSCSTDAEVRSMSWRRSRRMANNSYCARSIHRQNQS